MRLSLLLAALLLAVSAQAAKRNALFIDVESPVDDTPVDSEAQFRNVLKRMVAGDLPAIQFEFDSDELLVTSYTTLDAMVQILYSDPRLKLVVLAHTCSMGSEQYNLDLSERRAKAVKTYMVKKGVPPPTIRYRGMGFSKPVADNSTEEGRAKNRRVEFRVTSRDWQSVY